jgi:hypothetical protein
MFKLILRHEAISIGRWYMCKTKEKKHSLTPSLISGGGLAGLLRQKGVFAYEKA